MELINPGLGFLFWMVLVFLLLLFFLKKFAWKPILSMVDQRNNAIDKAMNAAEEARAEVAQMKADNQRIIQEAKLQKEAILKEAKQTSDKIVADSKDKAAAEANRILEDAQKRILQERQAAVQDIKSQVAEHAVEIAEKILKNQLQQPATQDSYLNDLVKDIELN